MSKLVIADEKMMSRLDNSGEPVMICAPDGRVLGYFTPTPPARLKLEPQISEEEIQRRLADKTSPTFTTAEVLGRLEKL